MMRSRSVWFWQRIITPHMANLAVGLASRGHEVMYIAEEPLDAHRKALGWEVPEMKGVTLCFAPTQNVAEDMATQAAAGSVHLTQGFRSNGSIGFAQKVISTRGLRHFIIMETVDLRGAVGMLKPLIYAWHLYRWRHSLDGVLAIGADTPEWLQRIAPDDIRIFPFAYFLKAPEGRFLPKQGKVFRFIFVGALVPRKRVDLFLKCLGDLSACKFEVEIVGDGPVRADLEALSNEILPGRVTFTGVVPMSNVSAHIAASDCLVLPSAHDGWGAVVSEALMLGTPVICSSACGARGLVEASGAGGVFATYDADRFRDLLAAVLFKTGADKFDRDAMRNWARCLNTATGAAYLENIIEAKVAGSKRFPTPPWEVNL